MTDRVQVSPTASLAYETRGAGLPLVALHGAYSARAEVREFVEPMIGARSVRRFYPDLPGHGESRPSNGVRTPDDVLDRPVVGGESRVPPASVVRDDGVPAELSPPDREAYEGYFVVRTTETLDRFRRCVVPATGDVDEETLERAIETGPHAIDPDSVGIDAPVLIVAGHHDHWVGWERQQALGARYARATVTTVADAGHALPHERPRLVAALLADWLDQALV